MGSIFLFFTGGLVVFWGLVYLIGCIVWLVLSPKICKAIFSGTSIATAAIGGALTAVAAAALGTVGAAAALGGVSPAMLGQAMAKFGGGGGAPGPDPTAGGGAPAVPPATDGKALSPAANEATRTSAAPNQTGGVVASALKASAAAPTTASAAATPLDGLGTPGNAPLGAAASGTAPGPAGLATPGAEAPRLARFGGVMKAGARIARAGGEIVKHAALAAGSEGSLGNYMQNHLALSKGNRRPLIADSRADDDVPEVFGKS